MNRSNNNNTEESRWRELCSEQNIKLGVFCLIGAVVMGFGMYIDPSIKSKNTKNSIELFINTCKFLDQKTFQDCVDTVSLIIAAPLVVILGAVLYNARKDIIDCCRKNDAESNVQNLPRAEVFNHLNDGNVQSNLQTSPEGAILDTQESPKKVSVEKQSQIKSRKEKTDLNLAAFK